MKYTSAGDLGIGTNVPASNFHFKASNGNLLFENSGSSKMYFRFKSGDDLKGSFIKIYDASNNFYFGIHPTESTYEWEDKDVIKITNTNGRIDLFPRPSIDNTYHKSFVTWSVSNIHENYVVYLSGSQKFCVLGSGQMQCTSILNSSDVSLKENIMDLSNGLELVKTLRPVKYNYIGDKLNEKGTKNIYYGLIAQEVERVLPDLVEENSEGIKGIRYTEMIPLLIEAINEQQNEIEALKSIVSRQSEAIKKTIDVTLEGEFTTTSTLYQNSPNPFNENTTIRFELNSEYATANIYVYDLTGKQLLNCKIHANESELSIPASKLRSGTYLYSLIVDGKIIDTKRMILID